MYAIVAKISVHGRDRIGYMVVAHTAGAQTDDRTGKIFWVLNHRYASRFGVETAELIQKEVGPDCVGRRVRAVEVPGIQKKVVGKRWMN